MTRKITFAVLALLLSANVYAESRYVIDQLVITLRSGQSTQHQILRTLPSGTKLEVLEAGDQYTKVRAPDGTEGWVLTQYITPKPIAKQLLAAAEAKLATLEKEAQQLRESQAELQTKDKSLSSDYQALSKEHKKLTDEVERLRRVAAKPLQLEEENQHLKKELLDLENNHELLRQENQLLRDSSDREWFLTGAGVIIGGIILGLVLPSLRPRKKSSWGSL